MEQDDIQRRNDFPKFAMNVAFYLYSKKPSVVKIEELRLIKSLKDFSLSYFKEGMKQLEKDFFVEANNQENESRDETQKKYTIGHDAIIQVESTIEDYLGEAGEEFSRDCEDDQALKEFDEIARLTNKTEIAKRLQDFILKYKNGYYYVGF